ncbi:hypothetical protein HVTV-2_gp79 [Haloarcula virus HVTV-2]|uniref:Uncharacterized protein n=1 Tax=Haloarcula vallismortis tailed virus 1 TaxID=1262528 RepID=L7TGW2_9CAUD|nr:hypothetical protein HVTV1_80 [Haloarcula vallismortis tailed virus 1]AGC34449.1 hypothetical protein HVTV1_80 [Haloarcula vallismortis tailed virus 1]UBF22886.1 hypothetical protein HVTV-2_gp79 [Haloarcula virus HVTV-2]
MSKEESYVAKWRTVEGEVQSKRFQSSSYPRVETHGETISPDNEPPLLDVYADDKRVLTIHGERFIHISREG